MFSVNLHLGETLVKRWQKVGYMENISDTSRHFFERRMLPQARIEMVQLFPIRRFSPPFSENRSRDVKIAHVGAYRSYFHVGLAACLENL